MYLWWSNNDMIHCNCFPSRVCCGSATFKSPVGHRQKKNVFFFQFCHADKLFLDKFFFGVCVCVVQAPPRIASNVFLLSGFGNRSGRVAISLFLVQQTKKVQVLLIKKLCHIIKKPLLHHKKKEPDPYYTTRCPTNKEGVMQGGKPSRHWSTQNLDA